MRPRETSPATSSSRAVSGLRGVTRSTPLRQDLGQEHRGLDREPARPVQPGRVDRCAQIAHRGVDPAQGMLGVAEHEIDRAAVDGAAGAGSEVMPAQRSQPIHERDQVLAVADGHRVVDAPARELIEQVARWVPGGHWAITPIARPRPVEVAERRPRGGLADGAKLASHARQTLDRVAPLHHGRVDADVVADGRTELPTDRGQVASLDLGIDPPKMAPHRQVGTAATAAELGHPVGQRQPVGDAVGTRASKLAGTQGRDDDRGILGRLGRREGRRAGLVDPVRIQVEARQGDLSQEPRPQRGRQVGRGQRLLAEIADGRQQPRVADRVKHQGGLRHQVGPAGRPGHARRLEAVVQRIGQLGGPEPGSGPPEQQTAPIVPRKLAASVQGRTVQSGRILPRQPHERVVRGSLAPAHGSVDAFRRGRRGSHPVPGQVGQVTGEVGGVVALDGLGDHAVPAHPRDAGQVLLDGVAHERVDEPMCASRPGRRHQTGRDRLVERREAGQRRAPDRVGDQTVRKLLADDCGDLQHLPRGRVQAVEPGPDGLTHRRGDWPAGRSAGRRPLAPELGDEERVAAGDAVDPGCIGGTSRAASRGSQQPGDSLRVEAAEQEPFGRSPPQQVGEHLGEPRPGPGIAVGRHQQRRELADPAGEIGEQDQRGLVGQVDVVEHDEHPVCLASGSEQGDHRVEGPLTGLGVGQRVRSQPVPAGRSSQ